MGASLHAAAALIVLVAPWTVGCRGRAGDPHEVDAPLVDANWSRSSAAPPWLAERSLRFAPTDAGSGGHELVAGAEAVVWRAGDRVAGAYTLEADLEIERGMVGLLLGARDPAGLADRREIDPDEVPVGGASLEELERARRSRILDHRWLVFAVRVDRSHLIWFIDGDDEHVVRPPRAITPQALHTEAQDTEASGDTQQRLRLEVEVGALATVFRIDGREVARAPRGHVPTDGAFGWWASAGTRGWVGPLHLRRGMR